MRYRVICAPILSDQNIHVLKILLTTLVCCLLLSPGLKAQSQNDSVRSPQDTISKGPVRELPAAQIPATQNPATQNPPAQNPVRKSPAPQTPASQAPSPQTPVPASPQILQIRDSNQLRSAAADSNKKLQDSLRRIKDSAEARLNAKFIRERIDGFQTVLKQHLFFRFFNKPVYRTVTERKTNDSDLLFYFLCGLVLYFAILKLAFGKYLNNLFTLFFRVTMRQNQIREQLLQTPLPSLLLNILFAISGGMYLNLILFHFGKNPAAGFWLSFSYCVGFLGLLYLGKLLILKTMGWIFNVSNATNTYLFIVFLVNKMIGMFLLPFLFILAFPHPVLISGMVTLSFILLIALFFYRFIISYRPIHNEINVGRLHFIIYLCAFEIAPLLLIYKVLLIFVDTNN